MPGMSGYEDNHPHKDDANHHDANHHYTYINEFTLKDKAVRASIEPNGKMGHPKSRRAGDTYKKPSGQAVGQVIKTESRRDKPSGK